MAAMKHAPQNQYVFPERSRSTPPSSPKQYQVVLPSRPTSPFSLSPQGSQAVPLPSEVLDQIFRYVSAFSNAQPTFHASSLVCRSWYLSSIAFLYSHPLISGKNYDPFVRAMCPSVNAHIRQNGLAELVKILDMSMLVHNGSKSLTARILGRVKGSMEIFVAPQASFGTNALAAISKCHRLRHLDLSFVSESIAMIDLIRSTSYLSDLESLRLPRCSAPDSWRAEPKYSWPPNLQSLHISGGIRDEAERHFNNLPLSVSQITFANLPHLSWDSMRNILKTQGPQLHHLEILAPIRSIEYAQWGYLENLMSLVPNLKYLKISLDLIGDYFFGSVDKPACLRRLDLDCFDTPAANNVNPDRIWDAIADGGFGTLRVLGVHRKVLGIGMADFGTGQNGMLDEIDEYLKALAREDGKNAEVSEKDAGVVLFGKKP